MSLVIYFVLLEFRVDPKIKYSSEKIPKKRYQGDRVLRLATKTSSAFETGLQTRRKVRLNRQASAPKLNVTYVYEATHTLQTNILLMEKVLHQLIL